MNNKRDLKYPVTYFLIMAVVAGILLFFSRPTNGQLPAAQGFEKGRLLAERQLLWIRVDSLQLLLNPLTADNERFEYLEHNDRLEFAAIDDQVFSDLFLDHGSLTELLKQADSGLKPLEGRNGFIAQVENKNEIRMVLLPAEVVQSIQLYARNIE